MERLTRRDKVSDYISREAAFNGILKLVPKVDNDGYPSVREEEKPPVKTNYDRLVSKSPEELAAWLADHPLVSEYDENNPNHKCWLDWLKQEAKE